MEARLCDNDHPDVWQINAETTAGVHFKAATILLRYEGSPYSNLVVSQIDLGDNLEYSGVLYVHH